jgi:outer membrane receptor protein involved in Fe transport
VITLGASYTVPLGRNKLTFNGNMYHNSGYIAEPDGFRRQEAYELYNASVDFTLDDQWTFSLWGKNLSNEAVDLFPSVNGLGGGVGVPRSSFAPPRTYGATIGVKL